MRVSYHKLRIEMDKRKVKWKDLVDKAHLSWSTTNKLSSDKEVSIKVLMKICSVLECNIEDVLEFEKEGK